MSSTSGTTQPTPCDGIAFTGPNAAAASSRLHLEVKDKATGRPVEARVGLYDATGRTPLPSQSASTVHRFGDEIRLLWLNRRTFWPSTNRQAFYVDGTYDASVPAGRYDLVGELGRGGMAVVWKAIQRGPGRFARAVAVKRILPSLGLSDDTKAMFAPITAASQNSKIVLVDTTLEQPDMAVSQIASDNEAGGRDTGIGLQTADIDALHAQLSERGVDVDPEVSRLGEPVPPLFWLRDPEGNTLMVVEVTG